MRRMQEKEEEMNQNQTTGDFIAGFISFPPSSCLATLQNIYYLVRDAAASHQAQECHWLE